MQDTGSNSSPTTSSNFSELLELISKSAVILGGVCYVFGVIIVNVHLAYYYLFTFNFFRTGYILTGGFSLMLLLIILWGTGKGMTYVHSKLRGFSFIVLWDSLNFVALGVCYYYRLTGYSSYYEADKSVFGVISAVIYAELFSSQLWRAGFGSGADTISPQILKSQPRTMYLSVALLFAYLLLYSDAIYPQLPPMLGGGRHQSVFIIPKKEAYSLFPIIGIKLSPSDSLNGGQRFSSSVPILFTDDNDYYFLVGRGTKEHSVSVKRDAIESIVYSDSLTDEMVNQIKLQPDSLRK